jgi:hypothetical protein
VIVGIAVAILAIYRALENADMAPLHQHHSAH